MSINITVGKWGGFYKYKGCNSYRVCIGFVAFTFFNKELDDIIAEWVTFKEREQLNKEEVDNKST